MDMKLPISKEIKLSLFLQRLLESAIFPFKQAKLSQLELTPDNILAVHPPAFFFRITWRKFYTKLCRKSLHLTQYLQLFASFRKEKKILDKPDTTFPLTLTVYEVQLYKNYAN